MTGSRRWQAAWFGVAITLLGSCGRTSAPSDTSKQGVMPTSPTPTPTPLSISARCLGPLHPGDYAGLACFVLVQDATGPASTDIAAFADLRAFGGPAELAIPRCPACGGPPWTFDLDLLVRPNVSPGVKTFPIWATDAQGRRAEAAASIEIVPR